MGKNTPLHIPDAEMAVHILVDKYTGDVYSHYNGMAQTYERLEPSTVNGSAFAG